MVVSTVALNHEDVRRALTEVLESAFFRSSGQCSSLLRYIVENTLLENNDELRERVIGSQVFDRPHDYDTGNDHIVRSRVSDVRKRLAQFHSEHVTDRTLRITIPTGSYRATFEQIPPADSCLAEPLFEESSGADLAPPPQPTVMPAAKRRGLTGFAGTQWLKKRYAVLMALCIVSGALVWHHYLPQKDRFDTFWSPLILGEKPALIYCGGGFVYKLSDGFLDDYRTKHHVANARREFFVDLKNGETLDGADLLPDRHFVPFGDLSSAARIVSTLTSYRKTYDLRYGEDVAFTEFQSSPVILLGGLNNSWTLRTMRNLRYVLEDDDHIVDRWQKNIQWVHQSDKDDLTRDDYAVISRLTQTETAGFVLTVAGIRMYGTRAAADLISNRVSMNRILANAPRNWSSRNLQILIHTHVVNDIPVSVDVVNVNYW